MTGQADVKWIWMAVALVVVAVPVLTVLFDREIRAVQQRVTELERRIEALAGAGRDAEPPVIDTAALEERVAAKLTARIGAQLTAQFAARQRERELDVLRTLSAMRPAEPEFVEEYWVEAEPTGPGHD